MPQRNGREAGFVDWLAQRDSTMPFDGPGLLIKNPFGKEREVIYGEEIYVDDG
jgi:hypothetical protein